MSASATIKITNGALRNIAAALNTLAQSPLEAVPNSRVRTARKILEVWFEPVEQVMQRYAEMFGHEQEPGSGAFEFNAVSLPQFQEAVKPLLEEVVEIPRLRAINVADVHKSGAMLTPIQMEALEEAGLIEGELEPALPNNPNARRPKRSRKK